MEKTLSLREANQSFARVVREVESGDVFTITRNGTPVARIAPIEGARRVLTPEQKAALARTFARANPGWPLGGEKLDREALYDERIDRYDPT
jgi:prevent-host-death family protein